MAKPTTLAERQAKESRLASLIAQEKVMMQRAKASPRAMLETAVAHNASKQRAANNRLGANEALMNTALAADARMAMGTPIDPVQLANAAPTPYTIKRGDTLSQLAQRNNVSVAQLMEWNGIKNANKIQEGAALSFGPQVMQAQPQALPTNPLAMSDADFQNTPFRLPQGNRPPGMYRG